MAVYLQMDGLSCADSWDALSVLLQSCAAAYHTAFTFTCLGFSTSLADQTAPDGQDAQSFWTYASYSGHMPVILDIRQSCLVC